MSTPIAHAVVSVAAGKTFLPAGMSARLWPLAVLCAVLPDVDAVGFAMGVPYAHVLGHRGLTHSLSFALLVSALVVSLGFRNVPRMSRRWWGLWAFFFLVGASHGLLDAMTDGGQGVAFFAPFSNARYFLPWRPLVVSPIGLGSLLSSWGLAVMKSEIVYVWIPSVLLAIVAGICRRSFAAKAVTPAANPALRDEPGHPPA